MHRSSKRRSRKTAARHARSDPSRTPDSPLKLPFRAYVVEPQKIFVPALIEALGRAGIEAAIVTPRFDPMQAAMLEPPMIFLDVDVDTAAPREVVRFAKSVAPFSRVVVYTSEEQELFQSVGADEIVSKTLQPGPFVDRMRQLARMGRG